MTVKLFLISFILFWLGLSVVVLLIKKLGVNITYDGLIYGKNLFEIALDVLIMPLLVKKRKGPINVKLYFK